jgi:hypothetical protein
MHFCQHFLRECCGVAMWLAVAVAVAVVGYFGVSEFHTDASQTAVNGEIEKLYHCMQNMLGTGTRFGLQD